MTLRILYRFTPNCKDTIRHSCTPLTPHNCLFSEGHPGWHGVFWLGRNMQSLVHALTLHLWSGVFIGCSDVEFSENHDQENFGLDQCHGFTNAEPRPLLKRTPGVLWYCQRMAVRYKEALWLEGQRLGEHLLTAHDRVVIDVACEWVGGVGVAIV